MYMPVPHDREAWKEAKDAKQNSWKEKKEGRAPTKRKAPIEPTAKTSAKKRKLESLKQLQVGPMHTNDDPR